MTTENADSGRETAAHPGDAPAAPDGGAGPALTLLQSMEAERAGLQRKVASLKEALFERERSLAEAGKREESLRLELEELQDAVGDLRTEMQAMKTEARRILHGVEAARSEQEPLERRVRKAERRGEALEADLKRAEAEKGRLEEALEITGQKNIRLTREREDQADELERILREKERLKTLLHASGQYAVQLARRDPAGERHAAAAGEDPEAPGASGRSRPGWFGRGDRKVTRITVVTPGQGNRSIPFRTRMPDRIRDNGQSILFDIPPGGAAYLSSKETSDFSLPPRRRSLQLSPGSDCTLSGSVALTGGSLSLWVIEYDERQRIQEQKVRLKGGAFHLNWRTHPSLDRLCLTFRLQGKGSMTLDPIVLKHGGSQE